MSFNDPGEGKGAADGREIGGPLFIMGATGSGKSELAVALAERLGAEIVNADAFQVYRGLETLTAAPSARARSQVPHHLYGVVDASDSFSAARFARLAREALAGIAARGKLGIVVGGSGLYLKSLTHRLTDLPSDEALREVLRAQPLHEKVARLRALDPVGAATMNLSNPRYVERALEISLLSGQPASELKTQWASVDSQNLRGVLVSWPRDLLYARINQRIERMFALESDAEACSPIVEVTKIEASYGFSATAEKALGVRQIRRHLAGELDPEELIADLQQATRHYAKRQITWFRRENWLKSVCLDPTTTPESAASEVLGLFNL
ncbi:MAG: tRNA (adenosine(37)-N6)-dimethylallyltransferase MiaA [Verrucomicrobiales bacterium]